MFSHNIRCRKHFSKAVHNLLNLKRFDLLTNPKFPVVFDS